MDKQNVEREKDMQAAVDALKKLSLGVLSKDLFVEIARLVVMPPVELVPLRMHEGKVQVLLLEREEGDTWSGQLHVPGSIIRSIDEKGSFTSALDRICKNELGDPHFDGEIIFMKFLFHQVKRGAEIAFVHWVELNKPVHGTFYDVDNLPHTIVDHQIPFIKEAAEQFKKSKQ